MKKFIVLVLSLALMYSFAALAEADGGEKINCLIEEGSYVIQIDDPEGDLDWVFESGDTDVVTLSEAGLTENAFVARFDPEQDGEVTVTARHYTGVACDALHTWDLRVENHMVTECTGGNTTMSPTEEDLEPWISGEWAELDARSVTLTITKNPELGWDVEAVSSLTHGAYIFKTTVYYDCEALGFVYDKGKFWDAPLDGDSELGEARIAGSIGCFALGYEGDNPESAKLTWHDEELDGDVVFIRDEAVADDFDGAYYTFEGSGVAMKLPENLQPTEGEPAENVFFEARNDDVFLQVQPVDGEFADLDALTEYYNDQEYIVRSEQVHLNGFDLLCSEGGDDNAMVYSLVSPEGTCYAFVFIPQSEHGADAIQQIISTICRSDRVDATGSSPEDENSAQKAVVASYTDRAGAFSFSYAPDAFEIVNEEYQDDAEDSDLILTMNGTYAFWGNVMIQFQKTKIDDPESFDDGFTALEEFGIEVTHGEWNGFEDVYMYAFDDTDAVEQRFIIRPEEGMSLAIIVVADKLDDEEMSMERDDLISDVLNTLRISNAPANEAAFDINSLQITESPDWVKALPQAQDEDVKQLFVIAGMGMDLTTATISMHERGENGSWQQILSTPGFVGRNGLILDEERAEGCGRTPVGVYRFNKAFGIAADPGCAIHYIQVDDDTYWSGDPNYHYNEMMNINDYPELALEDSEHIMDYTYQYQYCLNVSFNEEGTPGRGSAIFLHCFGPTKPYTGGCVAVPQNIMELIMRNVNEECVVIIDTAEKLNVTF